MLIKIFFPKNIFYRKKRCDLYGDVVIDESSVSYFVISDNYATNLRKLGSVVELNEGIISDNSITFSFDNDTPYIFLSYINIKTSIKQNSNIILYDAYQLSLLHCSARNSEDNSDISLLQHILNFKAEENIYKRELLSGQSVLRSIFGIIAYVKLQPFLHMLFRRTTLYNHFFDWKVCLAGIKQNRERVWKVLFDITLGVLVMISVSNCNQLAEGLMKLSADAISQLRVLLRSLKGNPIGLKLNVQLNNFFLDCFTYHVDLWAIFIVIISPIIHHLFLPVVVLGLFGLSYQLAILSDLIVLIILHAHCFYIYAALLYNIEKAGIEAMWKVVLGRRKNILKGRVISFDYMNRQLYLTTMFFTTLLFLTPTIFVYYIVFATVRTCVFFINYFLLGIRRKILNVPVFSFVKWIFGYYYDLSNVEIECMELPERSSLPIPALLFKLNVQKSFPWKNKFMQADDPFMFDNSPTPKTFLIGIIKGKMMSFS